MVGVTAGEELPEGDAVGVDVCCLADVAPQEGLRSHVAHSALRIQEAEHRSTGKLSAGSYVALRGNWVLVAMWLIVPCAQQKAEHRIRGT